MGVVMKAAQAKLRDAQEKRADAGAKRGAADQVAELAAAEKEKRQAPRARNGGMS